MGTTYRIGRFTVAPLVRALFRVRVFDAARIPEEGAVILAGSHRSNLDSVFLPLVTRRQVNFMAKREFFDYRPAAILFRHLGAFPVARGEPDRHALSRAVEVLAAGAVLGIYPEGTRRSGDKIADLHRGTSWLSAKAGVPIVPVGIGGSEGVQPKGSKTVRLVPVTLQCGPPVPPPSSPARVDLEEHTELVRAALQDVFDRACSRS